MARQYELTVLVFPTYTSDQLTLLMTSLQQLVEKAGGRVLSSEDWGKRRLAYQIAKVSEAFYYHLLLELPAEAVKGAEERLRLVEGVIRSLLVTKAS